MNPAEAQKAIVRIWSDVTNLLIAMLGKDALNDETRAGLLASLQVIPASSKETEQVALAAFFDDKLMHCDRSETAAADIHAALKKWWSVHYPHASWIPGPKRLGHALRAFGLCPRKTRGRIYWMGVELLAED